MDHQFPIIVHSSPSQLRVLFIIKENNKLQSLPITRNAFKFYFYRMKSCLITKEDKAQFSPISKSILKLSAFLELCIN